MDDIQENEPAADELLAGSEQSEAETEENTSEDEANTETDEGAANEGEADQDDEQDEDEQPKRKKRSGVERLRRQNEALRAELDALRSQAPSADSGDIDRAVLAEIGEPPKESDYPDYLAYERAMIAYEADKRAVTREIKKTFAGQAAQQHARQAEALEDYNERLDEADKAIPGLKSTIAKADLQVRNDIVPLIIESDKGPLLAHHLAKNPQKLAELNRMSPIAAAKEIGRLEARLSLPKPNTTTKAPAPVTPLKGGATPSNPSKELDGWLKQKYGR